MNFIMGWVVVMMLISKKCYFYLIILTREWSTYNSIQFLTGSLQLKFSLRNIQGLLCKTGNWKSTENLIEGLGYVTLNFILESYGGKRSNPSEK